MPWREANKTLSQKLETVTATPSDLPTVYHPSATASTLFGARHMPCAPASTYGACGVRSRSRMMGFGMPQQAARIAVLACAVLAVLAAHAPAADDYPARAVTIVVP